MATNKTENDDKMKIEDNEEKVEPEIINKRKEVMDNMEKIEKEFHNLKEKLYQDQIDWLKQDYQRIRTGSHEKYLEGCDDLERIRQEKIWRAKQWREYQLLNIENIFVSEDQQANDEFDSDKKQLQGKLLNAIQSKMGKLEDEKNSLSLNVEGTDLKSVSTRQLRNRRTREKETKDRRKLTPSHINYLLKDSEILEDLNYITKYHPTNPNFDRNKWLSFAPIGSA